jgi:DNA-binding transcriptional regulator YdaS (Cro superfamily)
MDPAEWRNKAGLSLRALAARLGCAWSSVRRWENGETEAPNSIAQAYERESKGEVTGADLHRVRKRYLRNSEKRKAA